jgi:hypothetical protein
MKPIEHSVLKMATPLKGVAYVMTVETNLFRGTKAKRCQLNTSRKIGKGIW